MIREVPGRKPRIHPDTWIDPSAEVIGDVTIEQRLVEGPAASALIEAAKEAELLVVGSRGHGGFTELLLGSVSQQVANHAPCPVVIVRAPDSES